jgi:hypothetical protein
LPLDVHEFSRGRKPQIRKQCSADGCANLTRYALFCSAHYEARRRALRVTS